MHHYLSLKTKPQFRAGLTECGYVVLFVCFCIAVNLQLLALNSRSFVSILLLEEWGLNDAFVFLGRWMLDSVTRFLCT